MDREDLYNNGVLVQGMGDIDRAKFSGELIAWKRTRETLSSHGDTEKNIKSSANQWL